MESAYLMIGKRFKVQDKKDETINQALASSNLMQNHPYNAVRSISGKKDEWPCHIPYNAVRSISGKKDEWPYHIIHSYSDSADFGIHYKGYDFCVGKIIESTGEPGKEVIEADPAELEKILKEVRKDIPDAKILVFSHWD